MGAASKRLPRHWRDGLGPEGSEGPCVVYLVLVRHFVEGFGVEVLRELPRQKPGGHASPAWFFNGLKFLLFARTDCISASGPRHHPAVPSTPTGYGAGQLPYLSLPLHVYPGRAPWLTLREETRRLGTIRSKQGSSSLPPNCLQRPLALPQLLHSSPPAAAVIQCNLYRAARSARADIRLLGKPGGRLLTDWLHGGATAHLPRSKTEALERRSGLSETGREVGMQLAQLLALQVGQQIAVYRGAQYTS